MSLIGCLLICAVTLCCSAQSDSDSCGKPSGEREMELQGTWDKDSFPSGSIVTFLCRPGYSRLGVIKKECKGGQWKYITTGKCAKKPCGHPGDIPFGSFELKEENEFVFGAVVVYQCDTGYQLVSKLNTRTCTATGWSNYAPTCEAKTCPPVTDLEGVEIASGSSDDEYSFGRVMRFQCKNPRFMIMGPTEIFCDTNGNWNAPPPTCQEIKCEEPTIPNGRVNRRPVYYLDDTLSYVCNDKYRKERSVDPSCSRNGWSPMPRCEEITCQPEYVRNGKIRNPKNTYKVGEIADVECEYGYILEIKPEEPRKCTQSGWSLPLNCVSVRCNNPHLENGYLYYNYWFPLRQNQNLLYYCNDNYVPLYKEYESRSYGTSTCTDNGWDPKPKCIETCSSRNAKVDQAYVDDTKSVYKSGEKVKFRCYAGYLAGDGKENGEIECLSNHRFSEARCTKFCPVQLTNGRLWTNKDTFEHGENAIYECEDGYKTLPNKRIDFKSCPWEKPPQCVEITCPLSDKRQKFKARDVVQFSCPDGSTLLGEEMSQCYYYGWDPKLPTCEDQNQVYAEKLNSAMCPPAPKPPNSQIIEKSNQNATLKCIGNYIMFGPESIQCVDGKWQTPPQCIFNKPCSTPTIENGFIPVKSKKNMYNIGDVLIYDCNPGYKLSGSDQSWCMDGSWSSRPVCTASPCGKPPYVQYATILKEKAQYKSGDTTTYVCIEGYALSDERIPRCIAGEWTDIPKCTSTSCVSPPTISNARLTTTKINYKSGEKANYQCERGFVFANTNYALCENTLWKQVPECRRENANCGPAPVVQYGETIQDRKPIHPHGTVMTYQCPDYYLPTGNKDVKCKNGKWDEPPVCIEPCTITKEGMAENNLALRWEYKDKLYAKHEEWIEFVCLTGYEDISQSLRIQCNRSVVPYPKCFKKGACIVSPIEMERNNISAIGGTEYESGKTVTFQCIEGFIPEKELTSVCKNKKINYPTCINANPCEISTVKLSENNLQLNLTDEPTKTTFAHNENIKFMCKSGFQFSKETTFTKCNNGIINYPQCIQGVKRCGPHDKIANGRIVSNAKINSFSSGDSLDIECDNTFEPTSSPTITCENGQWTIAPECVKKCGPPPAIENGRTQSEDKISFDLGSSLDIECNVNFVPNGSSSIICEKGEWINIPKCVRPCQISSEQLKKNNLILKSPDGLNEKYKPGEKIDVQCETDYFPEENDVLQAQCINGRITFPKCFLGKSCRITKNELEQNKLDLQQNGREEYEHNYLILFKCKQDFQTDASRQMRIKCNNGIIKYPRCFSKDFCKLSQENLDANNLQLGQDQDPEVSYDNNEKIKFECKPGFSINSGTTGICLNKIITYPRCFRIDESPV